MEIIKSKISGEILHVIFRFEELASMKDDRVDIVDAREFIQVAAIRMLQNRTFRPHKHNALPKITSRTQESWVVISGEIAVDHYDLDDQIIRTSILYAGDITITLKGGHNYTARSTTALVYEYKTGPYMDQAADKTFIG